MSKLYLLKLGEISLKGLNRREFEKALARNIKNKLRPEHSVITSKKGRMYLEVGDNCDKVEEKLSTVFGLDGFALSYTCEKDLNAICHIAEKLFREQNISPSESYKVITKREDKQFSLNSYQISCAVAEQIGKAFPSLKVDVKNPQHTIHVEIRAKAYVYLYSTKALGGLPVGTAGKGLSLLSGGIDSPVSSVKMASRGMREELIYFHSYPFTSNDALEKVKKLACIISPYLGGSILHIINLTPIQMRIKEVAQEKERTLMLRAAMMRIAHKVALERRCSCLITGEALSQVASQTLSSMDFTTRMADFLVLRPLVGMDKEEIISISKKIGTYETSILPFADCCSLFSPKHPMTNPNPDKERQNYQAMDVYKMEDEAVKTRQSICYNPNGEVYVPEV